MTCKDCLSYEACDNIMKRYAGLDGLNPNGMACGNFKDKTRFVEVKHGKWEKQQFIGRSGFFSVKDFTCSNCFESFAVEQGKGLMNYCPNCGARMECEK